MTPRWLRLSLRWKLILGSALIEIAMLSVLVINNVRLIETSLHEQFALRLGEISVLLNASISPAMAQLDYGPIHGVFAESRRKEGIVYFVLFDKKGKQVAIDGWTVDKPLPPIQAEIDLNSTLRRFDTQIPISIGGQSYGQLQFGISTEFLHIAREKLVRQSVAIAVLELVLSIALLVVLGVWLTRHLHKLEVASLAVGQGDFDVTVEVDSADEIARVGEAFNRMTLEIKHRLSDLGSSERLLRLSQQAAQIGSYAIDLNTGRWKSSPLFDAIVGIDEHFDRDIPGWESLLHPDDRAHITNNFQETARNGRAFSREYRIVRPINGEVRWVVAWGDYEFDSTGTPVLQVGAMQDITERKAAAGEIEHLAFYDPLTGLPNRRLLLDRLKQAMTSSTRSERYGALLFLDLDNFKTLNDTLGHDIGDLLLQQVAERLITCVREGDTVARLGGDEFVLMLEGLSENTQEAATQTEIVGGKILTTLNERYQLGGHAYHSSPSIGATLFTGHQGTIDDLLKRADLAMYQAKAAGRNTLRFFDPEMQAAVSTRAALETDLREAVLKEQFVLHYQAQVDGDGSLTGVEVLVRWQHPKRGIVSPADFIPFAEETGLILPLGHWVLQTACAQLAKWATRPEMAHLTVAVNISARQFGLPNFVEEVLAILDHHGANPERLKLELTESLLVNDVEGVIVKMTALKEKGVCFSLDDFGTGYSSLSYLKRLPLNQLKIDQGFVRDILNDPNDAAIAKMVVALAESMGLAVIAEGVEIEEQRISLARLGCHAYQGYLFSRPLPLDEFEAYVKRG
jgi:diguanylate cyclase (GGDEF)-like protein/PAS domain S-box-containing protein